MTAVAAEFIRRKDFRPALRADLQKARPALIAKLFCRRIFSLALWAFHDY
jgi:hypothetical protein